MSETVWWREGLRHAALLTIATLLDSAIGRPAAADSTIPVSAPGKHTAGNELAVASVEPGDHVTIAVATGQVVFNTSGPCAPSSYTVSAIGLPRSVYNDPGNLICYSSNLSCADPLPTAGHAELYVMVGG